MARYPLNLPEQLKKDAEQWAASQGVSLNQFIQWAVAEKVGSLSRGLDDPRFPQVTYRRGGGGEPVPVVRGKGVRVQTIVVASRDWGWSDRRIAGEYELNPSEVREALEFAAAHRLEVDRAFEAEAELAAGA